MDIASFFKAAKENGITALFVNQLHIGDNIGDTITAETVIGGDQNTTTTNTLSIPREMLQGASQSRAISSAAFGEGGPCKPLADGLHGSVWNWRIKANDEAASAFQQEYARQCDEHWNNR